MAGDDQQPDGRWISIDDFTPGIHEDFFASSGGGSTLVRNGAATRTNTYRVIADPVSGALTPLPRAVAGSTDTPAGTLSSGYYPAANMAMYVGDALVTGQVRAISVSDDPTPEVITVGYTFTYDNDGGGNGYRRYGLAREYQMFSGGGRADVYFAKDGSNVTPPVAGYAMHIEHGMYSAPCTYMLHDRLVAAAAASGAISAADQALTTYDTDFSGDYFTGFAQVHRYGVTAPGAWGSTVGFSFLVAHQGRALRLQGKVPSGGFVGSTNYRSADYIAYHPVRDVGGSEVLALLMEENQSGTGTAASISADQLLIVKNYGGAYMIRGSIANPTVVRLPFVQSTEGVMTRPALTPLGVVYGTRSGIHAYSGGDTSNHLSPQLDGEFWRIKNDTTNEFTFGIESRFEWWNPFVAVSNNWIMDSRTKGWWRLDIPSAHNDRPFSHYSVSPATGTLYAVHYKLDGASRAVWQTFTRDTLAQSWSWQSQPLVETTADMHEFQELEVVAMRPANASGTCTVTVTLTGIGQNGATLATRDVQFDLSTATADQPAIMRKRIIDTSGDGSFTARYVQVRIEASSSTGHAPKVFPGLKMWARKARSMPKWA